MKMYSTKYRHFFVLGLIVLLGLLLRSHAFLSGDFYFLIDQGRDMLLAEQVVVDHKLMLIGARAGFGGLFHGPLWIYLITPFFILSKGDPFLTLIPLYTTVTVTLIIIGYIIGSRLYGRSAGILIAFFLAISQPLIADAQFTTNAHLMPIIFLCYLGSVIFYLRGSSRALFGMFFCAGLGFQSEPAFAITLIPTSIIAIFLGRKLPGLKNLVAATILFLTPLATFIFFDLRHEFLMTKAVFRLFGTHSESLKGYEAYSDIFYRVQDRLSLFISSFSMPIYDDRPLVFFLIVVIFCWAFLLMRKKTRIQGIEYYFLLFFQIGFFLLYIVYPFPIWSHYLLALVVSSSMLLVLSMKVISEQRLGRAIVVVFLCLALLSPVTWIIKSYFLTPPLVLTSDGSYYNQQKVVDWIYADANAQAFSYFVYTSGTLTYNMDYLVRSHALNRSTQSLENQKSKLTYLIFYPTPDVNAHNFWKVNVLHTKIVPVAKKIFPGGILVEKLRITEAEEPVDPNYNQNLLFR